MLLRVYICGVDDHAVGSGIIFTLTGVAALAGWKQVFPFNYQVGMWNLWVKMFDLHVIGGNIEAFLAIGAFAAAIS
ncbi:hypothetical protein GCM10009075_12160 [Sphingomonas trueperi]